MDTTINQKIGLRIRAIRRAQHLTQEQLAEAVNLSPSYISRVETGDSTPSLESICHIADALQVGLQTLLYDLLVQNDQGDLINEIAVTASSLPPNVQKLALQYLKSLAACSSEF